MDRAKKKRRRRRVNGFLNGIQVPLALVAGAAVGPANVLQAHRANGNDFSATAGYANAIYTGYNPVNGSFSVHNMRDGLVPLAVGALVHKIVGQGLGVNRMLGQARIPVIRV